MFTKIVEKALNEQIEAEINDKNIAFSFEAADTVSDFIYAAAGSNSGIIAGVDLFSGFNIIMTLKHLLYNNRVRRSTTEKNIETIEKDHEDLKSAIEEYYCVAREYCNLQL